MAAPDKAAQEAESRARADAGVVAGEGADALAVVDDGAAGGDHGAAPAQRPAGDPEPAARPAPIAKSPLDTRRDEITKRFRVDRGQAADEARDEISDFTRSGMPPEFAENNAAVVEPQDEPAAAEPEVRAAAPDPAAKPQTFKVKVHGKEMELTLEEVTAQAQIALASDGILDAAKSKLKAVDDLFNTVRSRVDQPGKHQAPQNDTQPNDHAQPAADAVTEHHDDDFDKLVNAIQFGDPAEARQLLEKTISEKATTAATTAVSATMQSDRLRDEGARTARVLKDYQEKHPEIANDSRALAVIESDVLTQQVEDIRALGVDPAQLRPDGLAPTPGDISEAHKWYRAEGFKVRSPAEMLENGIKNLMEWRGVKTDKPADPAPAVDPNKRDVTVVVDRTARREAIPQQPGRTAAPRQEARQQTPQPRDRSSIVQQEIARRNAPRGKVAV